MLYSFKHAGCFINLVNIENELNKMRAETLGDAGKKLEILSGMLKSETRHRDRLLKIQTRLNVSLVTGSIGRKKRILNRLRERIGEKLARKESEILRMKEHKEKLFRNLVLQREALGVTDHSWIQEFYGKDNDKDN